MKPRSYAAAIMMAHKLVRQLSGYRSFGKLRYLRPDAKPVSVEYINGNRRASTRGFRRSRWTP